MKKSIRSICNKKFFFLLSLIATISACGGGGGGSKSDTKSSSTQSISSTATNISSSNTTLSAANSSIASSKSVSSTSAPTSSSSSVSFESGAKPNAFSFTSVNDAKANTTVTSNLITVTGITKTISISITDGEYAIDGGAYTSAPNTINNNQTVTIRLKSASASNALSSATLNLGGLTGSFDVTTLEDTAAPTAQIMFPTPVSLTEGSSILVRGVAGDNVNEIESLTVNGVAATTSDGYANWQAEVPLNAGANDLVVNVKDAANNIASNAATASIKSGSLIDNGTSDDISILNRPFSLNLDLSQNRVIVVDQDLWWVRVIAIDLTTSKSTLLTEDFNQTFGVAGSILDSEHNRLLIQYPEYAVAFDLTNYGRSLLPAAHSSAEAIILDGSRERALVVENDIKALSAVNLTSGERTIFSGSATPNSINHFVDPHGVALDANNNRALVTDSNPSNPSILSVDLDSGMRSLLSTNTIPNSENTLSNPANITVDLERNRALVIDGNKIISVDLTTGSRSTIGGPTIPDSVNKVSVPGAVTVNDTLDVGFVITDDYSKTIYVMDLITGKRVVFAK